MVYTRAIVRSFIPFAGIAFLLAVSDEKKLFLSVIAIPAAIAIPLIIRSTQKIISAVRTKQLIDKKSVILYGVTLAVMPAGACFFFMIDAALSHGADHGLFFDRCLFLITVGVVYPLADLMWYHAAQQADAGKIQKIKYSMMISQALILGVAVFLLVRIVGPPLNASLRLQYRDFAKKLIHYGINVQLQDRYGATPLWYAVHRVDVDMAARLLDRGARLDAEIAGLGLRRAVEDKNINMLKLLLDRGASPDSVYMGAPPLIVACHQKDAATIRILLERGADIHLKSKYPNMPYDGKSPLDVAREAGDAKVLELLLGYKKQ